MEFTHKSREEESSSEERALRSCFLGLPSELQGLIGSQLSRPHLIRLSPLSRVWRNIARSPVLISYNLRRFSFFDPIRNMSHSIQKVLDWKYISLHLSKDGWLLMSRYKGKSSHFFFFNPFTGEIIKLPVLCLPLDGITFSSSPTCSDCKVFAIIIPVSFSFTIYTCSPKDKAWTYKVFDNHEWFHMSVCNSIFYDGFFYSLGEKGSLGVFDPRKSAWSVLTMEKDVAENSWKNLENMAVQNFLVESTGKLLLVCADYKGRSVHIFCFNPLKIAWEEIYSLDDRTLFLSYNTSISTTISGVGMQNKIFFPGTRPEDPDPRKRSCPRCVVYSVKESKFYPDNDFSESTLYNYSIWIEPRW